MELEFINLNTNDYPLLREMLYLAIFVPEGDPPYPRSIVDHPEISKYVKNWGTIGDFGIKVKYNGDIIGAAWARLFNKNNKGFGFIDNTTPEISMAIIKEYRNKSIGTKLLEEIFKTARNLGYKALSLSVDKKNKAWNLYKRMGFKIVDEPGTDYVMKKEL